MFVTGRLVLVIALGVIPVIAVSVAGGAAAGWPAELVAGLWVVLCLIAAGTDTVFAADPRRLEIERRLPSRALRGTAVPTTLLIHNTGPRRLRGALRDAWQPTAGAPASRPRLDVPAGERRAVDIVLSPRRRGTLQSAFVAVRALGPLGLAGRQARLDAPGRLRVLPEFASRRHLPSRLARLREIDGATSVQMRGEGTEFDGLREYVRGDDVRSIDWRATARATSTMLRTWRPERDRQVVIVVDTGRTAAARVGDGDRLDASMEASLLLAALASRAGDHVHLVMFDRVLRARVTRVDPPALLPALIDAMAPVEAQLIDTDWDAAFAQVRRVTTRPSLVVLLTAQDSPDAARSFLGSLPQLTARTRVLVGTATDHATSPASRRTAEDVYGEAAAEQSAAEARAVASAVRRAGGESIAADPESLPTAIADRYLALKAAGRL